MMNRPNMGRSAKWGGACAPCAAARTRCIRPQSTTTTGSQSCDRCRSLGKDCVDQVSAPRKKRKAKSSISHEAKTTVPEERPNDLVDLSRTPGGVSSTAYSSLSGGNLFNGSLPNGELFNGSSPSGNLFNGNLPNGNYFNGSLSNGSDVSNRWHGSVSNASVSNGSVSNGSCSAGSPHHLSNNYSVSSISTSPQAQPSPSYIEAASKTQADVYASGPPMDPSCTCMGTIEARDLVPRESDEILSSIYRNQLSGPLPFVIIPAGTTVGQLQTTRPFLMKVIRMVASVRHLRSVRGQSRAVMQYISEAMLMRSERSLDLLQGILVFLGTYHYHCMAHAQFNNLIRLAVSLVEDLDLSNCPKSQRGRTLVRAEEPAPRTNEEKRALLGVWYMSSNAGLLTDQLAFTKYTEYMDQCLRDLDEAGEYRTDQLLIQLVRIQRLTERIFQYHGNDSSIDERRAAPESLSMARLEAFRSELESLRNALPPHLKSDYLLSCYHNRAYLRIYSPLLAGSHLPDADPHSFSSLQLSGLPIADIFSHFTSALKAWLETWLAIPVCSYFYMPLPAYTQLVHGAMMLSRWVRVAGPGAVRFSTPNNSSSSSNSVAASPAYSSAPGTSRQQQQQQQQQQTPWRQQPPPALSGIPSCPDLSFPRPPASPAVQIASAGILNSLRARVAGDPLLQIDVLGTLDAMAVRFEAAKKEMAAAQGVEWENDTWDYAARHLKMKKERVGRWCAVVFYAAENNQNNNGSNSGGGNGNGNNNGNGDGNNYSSNNSNYGKGGPMIKGHDSVLDGSNRGGEPGGAGGAMDEILPDTRLDDDLEWMTSGYDMDNMQWESFMFDELLRDIHP